MKPSGSASIYGARRCWRRWSFAAFSDCTGRPCFTTKGLCFLPLWFSSRCLKPVSPKIIYSAKVFLKDCLNLGLETSRATFRGVPPYGWMKPAHQLSPRHPCEKGRLCPALAIFCWMQPSKLPSPREVQRINMVLGENKESFLVIQMCSLKWSNLQQQAHTAHRL